jgi:acyl carrier protein
MSTNPVISEPEAMIRVVLSEEGGLGDVADDIDGDADLFEAGLTSLGVVSVLMKLEDSLQLSFPDDLVSVDTFSRIASIRAAVERLTGGG